MMTMKHWFTDCYRRHLMDMHIEDWNEAFLSEFSPETYVEKLKRAHIEVPMIYLQSHVGHCYWPTKTGHMHSALRGREDMIRRLVGLCHAEGMHPVGYYSLIYNTYEEDSRSEWRILMRSAHRPDSAAGGTVCFARTIPNTASLSRRRSTRWPNISRWTACSMTCCSGQTSALRPLQGPLPCRNGQGSVPGAELG